eukprot:scpid89783/ scgid28251/ 
MTRLLPFPEPGSIITKHSLSNTSRSEYHRPESCNTSRGLAQRSTNSSVYKDMDDNITHRSNFGIGHKRQRSHVRVHMCNSSSLPQLEKNGLFIANLNSTKLHQVLGSGPSSD